MEAALTLERINYECRLYGDDVYYAFTQYCGGMLTAEGSESAAKAHAFVAVAHRLLGTETLRLLWEAVEREGPADGERSARNHADNPPFQ